MKPVMGKYRRGHTRTWLGTKVADGKPGTATGHNQARHHPAKVWKRRAVTRAGSDRPKRSGPAR